MVKAYRIFLVMVIVCIMPVPGWAQTNTVMVGVDDDQLFAGAWFTVTPRLDLMVSLYDNSKIGWGFDYHNNGKSLKLSSEWQEYELMFKSAGGVLHYHQDDAAGTASGAVNGNFGKLGLKGHYSTMEDAYQSGSVDAQWEGTDWRSLLHSAYRNDAQRRNNYRFKNAWSTGHGRWLIDLQSNQFSEASHFLIGEGAELAWRSVSECWQIALGRFHETETDLAETRLQLQWRDRRQRQFARNTLGFDTQITEYRYGNHMAQHIGDLTGWWRYNLKSGSIKWDLENIWSAGDTPFRFDDENDYSCFTRIELDWQKTYHSSFSIKYDLQKSRWRNVSGLLEMLLGSWSGSLSANYDLGAEYGDYELVYLILVTSPARNFTVSQSLNSQFESLDTDVEWAISFASGDGLRIKLAYDWKESDLDSLLLQYRSEGLGIFTLTYDLDKPKIELVYTWD